MLRYKAIVSYDGTHYSGWQIQPKHVTIQGQLENALHKLTGQNIRVYCSGRTDQGVHARAQVIHFDSQANLLKEKWRIGMNALLPPDIRVESVRRANPKFDARMDATAKEYRYFIWNAPVLPAYCRLYRTHVRAPLNTKAMRDAAARLTGKHDFSAFTANPRREIGEAVRQLDVLRVQRRGREITIVACGEGFLYKMVRSLAGFLIRVGIGELTPDDATRILFSKQRTAHVPTAPPEGLFLWKVQY